MTYRTGRTLGRTVYEQVGGEPSKDDTFIGIMDTPELAAMVVGALNHAFPTGVDMSKIRRERSQ